MMNQAWLSCVRFPFLIQEFCEFESFHFARSSTVFSFTFLWVSSSVVFFTIIITPLKKNEEESNRESNLRTFLPWLIVSYVKSFQ